MKSLIVVVVIVYTNIILAQNVEANSSENTGSSSVMLTLRNYESGWVFNNKKIDGDIYVFKRDACGNTVWFNTYGGGADDGGMCIRETSDGGFIVAGLSQQGAGNYDVSLMKLDVNGIVTWFQDFGGPNDDRGLQVQETSDGGFIVSGHTSSFGAGGWDAYLIKTDINGALQWSKTYGGGGADYGTAPR